MPLTCWVMPIPHTRQEPANGGLAYQRAAWAMSRFGTPATRSACSSVNGSSDCRQVSNPSVRARTKSRLARPSSRITFAIALKRVTSVPGRWAIQRSAWLTSSMRLGLMTTMRSEEHTSELQSQSNLVCRLLLEKKKKIVTHTFSIPSPILQSPHVFDMFDITGSLYYRDLFVTHYTRPLIGRPQVVKARPLALL